MLVIYSQLDSSQLSEALASETETWKNFGCDRGVGFWDATDIVFDNFG